MSARGWLLGALLSGCQGDRLDLDCERDSDCAVYAGIGVGDCLREGDQGVCIWTCATDADCAADDGLRRVCTPYEDADGTWCLQSCADGDQVDGLPDCPDGFRCRSAGADGEDLQVCFPD